MLVSKMTVQWQRSSSYESALPDESCDITEKLCPSVTLPRTLSKSEINGNALLHKSTEDIWKTCTQKLALEFIDLTYQVKVSRSGEFFLNVIVMGCKHFSTLVYFSKYNYKMFNFKCSCIVRRRRGIQWILAMISSMGLCLWLFFL